MHIMIILKYPPGKGPQVQELFQTVPALPDSVERVAIYTTMEGVVKSYAIFEIDDMKVEEGMNGLLTRIAGYNVVEGFRWKIKWVRFAQPEAES